MKIQEIHRDKRVDAFFIEHWGNDFIVSGGKKLYGHDLEGLAIFDRDKIIGLLTYHISGDECEIISLDSLQPKKGIGTELMEEMISKFKRNEVLERLWLMTTNDNTDAIKFYEKRGFFIKAVHLNAIEASRKLGQKIPAIANNGIPIRDEVEMEYLDKK